MFKIQTFKTLIRIIMTMDTKQVEWQHINKQSNRFRHRRPIKENHRYWHCAIILAGFLTASSSFALAPSLTVPQDGSWGSIVPPADEGKPPLLNVQLTPVSESSIRLSWFDNSDRAAGYTVYRSQAGGLELPIESLGPITRADHWGVYTDTGLTPDTEYVYRVAAYNSNGITPNFGVRAYTDRKAPSSQLVARLHILTQNVQGLPTDKDWVDWAIGSTDCEQRGSSFGNGLAISNPAFTLVGLQELYSEAPLGDRFTCDPKYVLDAANSTGRYPVARSILGQYLDNTDNAILFQPRAGLATGGTGLLSLGQMSKSHGEAWLGNYNGLLGQRSKQGFTFSSVAVPGTDLEVDVYVVHLYSRVADHCDFLCQRGELEQLAHRIAEESGNSGNPVIVMGDFNLPGPPATPDSGDGYGASYIDLKEALLDPRDLWIENHPNEDGITSGPTVDNLRGQRLDYIILPTDPYLTNNPYSVFIRNRADVRVATDFGPVSDHRGVAVTVEIRVNFTATLNPQVSTESTQAEADLEVQIGRAHV